MQPERGLLHPGALVSIVLLVANDHWFKAAAPGLITGVSTQRSPSSASAGIA
jgi:hypothetical protein